LWDPEEFLSCRIDHLNDMIHFLRAQCCLFNSWYTPPHCLGMCSSVQKSVVHELSIRPALTQKILKDRMGCWFLSHGQVPWDILERVPEQKKLSHRKLLNF
jgi:hypothetical protein